MRRFSAAALTALALLTAACGQKTGVAGSVAAGVSDGALAGGEESLDGGAAAGEETTGDGDGTTKSTAGGGTRTGGSGGTAGGAAGGTAGGGGGATGPLDRTGITATEIKIGIHAPETGAAAVSTFRDGVGVYSQFAGKIPGLGNRKMTILARDDKFDSAEARRVCKDLVETQKVFLLIGGAGVDAINSCAQYAASKGVPYLSPGVTEGPFKSLTNYFALSETYSQQNAQLAQMIKSQIKKTRVGVILTDSPFLNETLANIKSEAAKAGLTVVYEGRLKHDAGKTETDTQISNLKKKTAEVVYALISPTVFGFLVSSAKQQSYNPTFTGPGLSNGVNLLAKAICQPPFPDVRYFSPMVQMDVIDSHDKDYRPAYRQKNGSASQPDDIGVLLWGIEKTVRLLMEADGPDLSRQTFIQAISSGKTFASNVYAPIKYGGPPHFGATTTTLLQLDCGNLEYKTVKAFASSF
jgi:ABC-type branched-subunit amino acid transport system substrate-binding protein